VSQILQPFEADEALEASFLGKPVLPFNEGRRFALGLLEEDHLKSRHRYFSCMFALLRTDVKAVWHDRRQKPQTLKNRSALPASKRYRKEQRGEAEASPLFTEAAQNPRIIQSSLWQR
jgi:hypothetical protein